MGSNDKKDDTKKMTKMLSLLEELKSERRVAELRLKESEGDLDKQGFKSIEEAEKAHAKATKKLEAKVAAFYKEAEAINDEFDKRFGEKEAA